MQPIVYIDTSKIRSDKLEELKVAIKGLAAFVEANMPRLISYGFFLDGNQTELTVVAVHQDLASLAFHLDVGAAEFRKFGNLIDLLKIDVYGNIDEAVLKRLHQKAQMLGTGTVRVHKFYAGFAR